MACSSCNRNNRRSNNWGCRKAVQNTRWPSCGGNSCTNGCGVCSNHCGSGCNHCSSCSNHCACHQNTCTRCGSATVCSGRNPVYAQPYDGSRISRYRRDWYEENPWRRDEGCAARSCADRWNGCQDPCFPFYCGPCGPVEPDCGCNNNCTCNNHCTCNDSCVCEENCSCGSDCGSCICREPVYGFFTQVGTIDVNAGGMIPFNGGSTVEGIWKDGGELTLDTAGVYMVTLSADIPENVTLYTELDVRVNGVTNPGGRLVLDKDYTGAPLMSNTQTVITVNEGAVLTVTSTESFAFSIGEASHPIVTLSVVKLS